MDFIMLGFKKVFYVFFENVRHFLKIHFLTDAFTRIENRLLTGFSGTFLI